MKRDTRMMPTKSVNKKQGGFTLIEIAIVLVIIGLLLGGVLKGQELINTARVRALNNS
ncbi:MAG: prepilin-type N-terminal cleavage/methylation domain-containing protein, partial [Thiotrichaceae bacterium]|nr:prepilin-type N-terminal cleavage/methylation domain-containing protein [Thiotrichaceae bacterium]